MLQPRARGQRIGDIHERRRDARHRAVRERRRHRMQLREALRLAAERVVERSRRIGQQRARRQHRQAQAQAIRAVARFEFAQVPARETLVEAQALRDVAAQREQRAVERLHAACDGRFEAVHRERDARAVAPQRPALQPRRTRPRERGRHEPVRAERADEVGVHQLFEHRGQESRVERRDVAAQHHHHVAVRARDRAVQPHRARRMGCVRLEHLGVGERGKHVPRDRVAHFHAARAAVVAAHDRDARQRPRQVQLARCDVLAAQVHRATDQPGERAGLRRLAERRAQEPRRGIHRPRRAQRLADAQAGLRPRRLAARRFVQQGERGSDVAARTRDLAEAGGPAWIVGGKLAQVREGFVRFIQPPGRHRGDRAQQPGVGERGIRGRQLRRQLTRDVRLAARERSTGIGEGRRRIHAPPILSQRRVSRPRIRHGAGSSARVARSRSPRLRHPNPCCRRRST